MMLSSKYLSSRLFLLSGRRNVVPFGNIRATVPKVRLSQQILPLSHASFLLSSRYQEQRVPKSRSLAWTGQRSMSLKVSSRWCQEDGDIKAAPSAVAEEGKKSQKKKSKSHSADENRNMRLADIQQKAADLLGKGKYEEAQAALESVLCVQKEMGKDDIVVANTKTQIAFALQSRNKYEASLPFYEEALPVLRKQYENEKDTGSSVDHTQEHTFVVPDPSIGLHALAILLCNYSDSLAEIDRMDEAIELSKEALPLCEKAWGEENEYTAAVRSNLSTYLYRSSQYEEALPHAEKALQDLTKMSGGISSLSQSACSNVVSILNALGRVEEADKIREKYNNEDLQLEVSQDLSNQVSEEKVKKVVDRLSKEDFRRELDPKGFLETAGEADSQLEDFITNWRKSGFPLDKDVEKALRSEVARIDDLVESGKYSIEDVLQGSMEEWQSSLENLQKKEKFTLRKLPDELDDDKSTEKMDASFEKEPFGLDAFDPDPRSKSAIRKDQKQRRKYKKAPRPPGF